MNLVKYKEYEGTAELDMDRLVCRGKILFIADLVTYESATPGGLQKEFEAAVNDYLDTCKEIGKEPQKPFSGAFNVRVPPSMHRDAALRAKRESKFLNEVVVCALDHYLYGTAQNVYKVNIYSGGETSKSYQASTSSPPLKETVNVVRH